MRTTININDDLMDALQKYTKARTKTQAVEYAIKEFLKKREIEDLIALSGRIDIDPNWEEQEKAELDEYADHS